MADSDYMSVVFWEASSVKSKSKDLGGGIRRISEKVVKVHKDVVGKSLGALISDVNDILEATESEYDKIMLDEVSVGVELTAQGTFRLIGGVSAGISSAFTLTFKIKS